MTAKAAGVAALLIILGGFFFDKTEKENGEDKTRLEPTGFGGGGGGVR